jgi:hypothetical protein
VFSETYERETPSTAISTTVGQWRIGEEETEMERRRVGAHDAAQEAEEAQATAASEGRWPRICESMRTAEAMGVRCAHVL